VVEEVGAEEGGRRKLQTVVVELAEVDHQIQHVRAV